MNKETEKYLIKENKKYKEIIYNAIEYIEIVKSFNEEYKDDWEFKVFIPHLLNILKGSDNNE